MLRALPRNLAVVDTPALVAVRSMGLCTRQSKAFWAESEQHKVSTKISSVWPDYSKNSYHRERRVTQRNTTEGLTPSE